MWEKVKPDLDAEFHGLVHRDFPIEDFIRHVWNFKPEDIPHGEYHLPYWFTSSYYRTFFYCKSLTTYGNDVVIEGDRLAGRRLLTLIQDCIEKFQKAQRRREESTSTAKNIRLPGDFRFMHGREPTNKDSPQNPTFVYEFTNSLPTEPVNWLYTGVFGELRKTGKIPYDYDTHDQIEIDLSKLKVGRELAPDLVY